MENRENIIAAALCAVSGMGQASMKKLYETTGNVEEILTLKEERIREITGRCVLSDLLKEWKHGEEEVYAKMVKYTHEMNQKGIHYVFCGEEHYPKRLKDIVDYPFALYYLGNLPEEDRPTVSVIGARECSEYGRNCAELFGKTLGAKGVQIISGMARGIDGISQEAALNVGGNSFGILGCGVDICYPKENRSLYEKLKRNGGVISEYLPGMEPKSNLFPARNRIISALADILLVVEARMKSGTYITVCQALEQGREIYAIPGRITDGLSDGCNRLIRDGAGIATSPEDILETLMFKLGKEEEIVTGSEESKYAGNETVEKKPSLDWSDNLGGAILRILEETPKTIDELLEGVKRFGFDPSYTDMLCKLTELTIDGRCTEVGNAYKRIR
jgi:DNA processing protein